MSAARRPLFVARESYRRRRLADGMRLLPFLGVGLFLAPLLWFRAGEAGTTSAYSYIFSVWALLIAAGFLLARRLRRSGALEADAADGATEDEGAARTERGAP